MPTQFPPIPDSPREPWAQDLPADIEARYVSSRTEHIERTAESMKDFLRMIPDFASVSDEALEYASMLLATQERDAFEQGIQVGSDKTTEVIGKQCTSTGLIKETLIIRRRSLVGIYLS